MCDAGEHRSRIIAIAAAIPQFQRARHVAAGGREPGNENAAANLEGGHRVAQGRKRQSGKPVLACHLTHHLHQAPGKCTTARFGFVLYGSAGKLRLHITGIKRRLITQRPGVPGRFLFDNGANEFGPNRVHMSGVMGERNQLRRWKDAGHLKLQGRSKKGSSQIIDGTTL